jgi:pyruvyltransferase
MKFFLKNIMRSILYFYYKVFYNENDSIKIMYYDKNFGDAINPLLVKALSGLQPLRVNPKYYQFDHIFAIGSILQTANSHTVIWGAGLISEDAICKETPKKICAVRGPKTRELLLKQNIDCPEIYGDPALLMPKIYNPNIEKKYKLGIIPHYIDQDVEWLKSINSSDVLVINILRDDPLEFIDELLSCEKVASSSLHGLIAADAYGIPSTWIKFSENIFGGDFKFIDYFLSVKRNDKNAFIIDTSTTIEDISLQFYEYKIEIDLNLLIQSAPFPIKFKAEVSQ